MVSIPKVEIRLLPWCSLSFWELTCKSFLDSRNLSRTYDCQEEGRWSRGHPWCWCCFPRLHTQGMCIQLHLLNDRQGVWPHPPCRKTEFWGGDQGEKTTKPLVLAGQLRWTGKDQRGWEQCRSRPPALALRGAGAVHTLWSPPQAAVPPFPETNVWKMFQAKPNSNYSPWLGKDETHITYSAHASFFFPLC